MAISTKTCSGCKSTKQVSEFSKCKNYADGYQGRCKSCKALYQRSYSKTPSGKESANRYRAKTRGTKKAATWYRNRNLQKKYGITIQEFDNMLAAQNGRCAICRTDNPGDRSFHVDHCHETGDIRGILCGPCNKGLGMFRDSAALLDRGAEYLRA